ncbi:uncharacterized protein L201_005688 [Kwoniella dendrophila CBS 6074]|uniref:Vacuolar protein sorting-associated protein 62 n=1 Tax=Kwoniella dendrophila CBS 6074 TaxID=1295534 RepID=A0AAX4JZ80_9TREE
MPSAAAIWCLSFLAGQVVSSPLRSVKQTQGSFLAPANSNPAVEISDPSTSSESIIKLLEQYAPIFKLSELESFFPSSVDYMLPHYNFTESSSGEITTIDPSLLNRSQIDQLPSSGSGLFLSIKEPHNPQPFLDEESAYLFGPYGRDNITQNAQRKRQHSRGNNQNERGQVEEEVYGFGVDQGNGIVDLWYWTFYPFNFGKPIGLFGILGNHVADWEHLRMRTVNGTPVSADYTTHTGGRFSAGTFRWEDIEKIDGRPVAYVAAGSHGIGNLFKLIDLTDDEGPIWDTKNHVVPAIYWDGPENRRKIWHQGNQSWLNFRGKWGNIGENNCWWHRVVGYCQIVDAPSGPNRYFGLPPDCIIAPLTTGSSSYNFRFSSSVLDWAKDHNIALVQVDQVCTRPKKNPDDDDDDDDEDDTDEQTKRPHVHKYNDEVEGEIEVWNIKGVTQFKGIERHTVSVNPCRGRQSAVRAYKLSLCLINGKCLSQSFERRICTYEQDKKGYKFGSSVHLDDIDDWRWNY